MGIDYNFKRSPGYVIGLMAVIAVALVLLYFFDGERDKKMPVYPLNFQWDAVEISVEGDIYTLPPSEHTRFRRLKFHPASDRVKFSGDVILTAGDKIFLLGITEKPLKATFIKIPGAGNYVIKGDLKKMFDWEKKDD